MHININSVYQFNRSALAGALKIVMVENIWLHHLSVSVSCFLCLSLSLLIYINIHICVSIHICVCVCVCVCVCACMHDDILKMGS